MTEYKDKVGEEYQLEADTNAKECWKLFKKLVMRATEEIMWSHQRKETPGE